MLSKAAVVLTTLFLIIFLKIMPQYSGMPTASLIDKMERLASIDEPKIILIGNSNLTFGIKSELIEKEIGRQVVNMGLHGGLGNAFHEEMAKIHSNPGDLVIICHNTYSDEDVISNPALAWITIENHFNLWRLIRNKDIFRMAQGFPTYLNRAVGVWKTGTGNQIPENTTSSRAAYNEYGDIGFKREKSVYEIKPDDCEFPAVGDGCAARINRLNRYLEERGATLLIAAYPIADGTFTRGKEDYRKFQEELENRVQCPVISDFADYFFPYSDFYNTWLHLTDSGAEKRTRQLIRDIKAYLDASASLNAER